MSKGTGLLREQNKRKVLSLIRQLGKTSRQDLAKQMNVSKNTISLIVDEFINNQILKETGFKEPGSKGRPKVIIEINKKGYKSLGFAISKKGIEYSVVNYYGEVVERETLSYIGNDPDYIKMKLDSMIKTLLEKYDNVLGIGIGIPGIVDSNKSMVYNSTHMGWKNVSFQGFENLNVPVFVQNSVNMSAISAIEKEGNRNGGSSFYVRVGEGVGGTFIIDNKIMNGGSWTAGEIGHISINPNGELCACGQRGCLELLISNNAFKKRLGELGYSYPIEEKVVSNQDDTSLEINSVVKNYGINLGKALVQVIHLVNPNQIMIDTPYNIYKDFSNGCLQYINENALEIPYQKTKIIFGNERYSMSIGAALSPIINFERFIL